MHVLYWPGLLHPTLRPCGTDRIPCIQRVAYMQSTESRADRACSVQPATLCSTAASIAECAAGHGVCGDDHALQPAGGLTC